MERGNLYLKEGNNFFSQKGMCNRSGDILICESGLEASRMIWVLYVFDPILLVIS